MTVRELKNTLEGNTMQKYLNVNIKGNRKLKNNGDVRFMIWNLPAQITCPYATAHCKKYCYAKKAERVYPAVLPSRQLNFEASKKETFTLDMILTISHLMTSRAYAGKKVYFRIHESGDFYSQDYFDKWLEIAKFFEKNNIIFLAYTKSIKFVHDLPNNFIVRYSIWDDSPAEGLIEMARKNLCTYTADRLDETKIAKLGDDYCECKNCATCGKCYTKSRKNIVCNLH